MTHRTPPSELLERIAYADPRETPNPRDILSSLGEVVYDWDLLGDRLLWGPNVNEVLGMTGEPPVDSGAAFANRIAPESGTPPHEAILRSRERDPGSGVKYHLHYSLMPNPGSQRRIWVEDIGRWFTGPGGRPARAHGVLRVLNNAAGGEPKFAPVNHDPLTGALARHRFVELATRMFSESSHNRSRCSLMLIALDDLASINRNYGYEAADEIIAATARKLRSVLRARDLVARYAGNKFAVALGGCDAQQLAATAQRCIKAVGETSVTAEIGPLRPSIRIGGAVAPLISTFSNAIFLHVEEALENARAPGAPRFVAYEPDLARESARQKTRRIAEQIVSALNEKRISIVAEPIVDARTGAIAFYEALMRLGLEDGELLAPSAAFSVAEKVGLAPLLDQRVLELALAQLAADPKLTLSVNMSGLTAREPDWPDRTRALLNRFPGCARRLIVEITETCAIEDIDSARRTIALLKDMGARIAMDDFGAGHTSFRNLRNLELDLIKIDGAFVQNLARSVDDRFFVRTLVDLARHVGVPTVAEWVEDEETARLLREWGVDYFQGNLYGVAKILPAPTAAGRDDIAA